MNKYKTAIILGIAVVLVTAIFDIMSATSGVFGTLTDYTNGNYTAGWWNLFFSINLLLFAILPVAYFFLVRKDKSEAIGIFTTSIIMFYFGLSDIFYFLFQGVWIPKTLPWLMGNPFISKISLFLGFTTVTNFTLIVSVIIGFILVLLSTKLLEKIN